MALRRVTARRKRNGCRDVWPIFEGAAQRPPNWPGWPDGKQFALVLTHDVEGLRGLQQCLQLAELELQAGLKSSFNFIPEGSYQLPPTLREWLVRHDFEVGVHDLQHDGKLFNSRRGFLEKAQRINQYLRDWNATGFRGGFMLRNLEWLHELEIAYDSSTFDTDPFEFQSEGAGTIFPYWIPRPLPGAGVEPKRVGGYVEVPYTLPQDSTLFLVLGEQSPEIWMRKLDWIARHGGMALVNVHPDYVDFSGRANRHRQYPVSLYSDFLAYVTKEYSGRFWNPTPKNLAIWFDGTRTAQTPPKADQSSIAQPMASPEPPPNKLRSKRAAILLYSYFPADPRPFRAAMAMQQAGMQVDLLCLSDHPGTARKEIVHGIHVFRVAMARRREAAWVYLWQYSRFFFSSFAFLLRRGLIRKYDIVHVHNMPDFLVFAAVPLKLRGTPILLDLHDPMPELMMTIYGLRDSAWQVRLLRTIERLSTEIADHVLTPNLSFVKLFTSRGIPAKKLTIVMNAPIEPEFDLGPSELRGAIGVTKDRIFRLMHHGLIAERSGIDLLIRAIAIVRNDIPALQLDIYGYPTGELPKLLALADQLGIANLVHYHGAASRTQIADAIKAADLGVVSCQPSPFTKINLPTRIFEFLSLKCPVVAPATAGIQDYFNSDQLSLYRPGDADDLAATIRWVWRNPAPVRTKIDRAHEVYLANAWTKQKATFLACLNGLIVPESRSRPRRICMVTHSFYESDNRVTRYAEALAAQGDDVEVFALRSSRQIPKKETIEGVKIYRIQERLKKNEKTLAGYLWPLVRFLVVSSWHVTRRHARRRYDLVHIHNIPDFLVFAAWYPRLTGTRVILDIHDIVPEFFVSKFVVPTRKSKTAGSAQRLLFRSLLFMERCSAAFANHIIIANHLWLDRYTERTQTQGRCTAMINYVDPKIFRPHQRHRTDTRKIVIFPGGLQWHQGIDLAIRAVAKLVPDMPALEFHIYGDGNAKESLIQLTAVLNLQDHVRFFKPLSVREISSVMANADLGVVPKRADSFGNEAYSTKIMEFMSVGVPVVVASTMVDRYYFNDTLVRFFPAGDVDALARAIHEVLSNPKTATNMVAQGSEFVTHNSWTERKREYLELVEQLAVSQ